MSGRREDSEDSLNRERELIQIRESLRGLRFGVVRIVIQDGVVIQIERTERRRLRRNMTADGEYPL